jgi:hypothetical protein
LREVPEADRGWQVERRAVRCRSCDAVSVFEPARVGQPCGFCGSTALVDYEEIRAPIRPHGVLPFKIDPEAARERGRAWLRSRWFAPASLERAVVEQVRGIYLPYWTFDAHAFCHWTADAGYYHYTTERVRDRTGRLRTRQVRHVRWRPTRGVLEHVFDDLLIPATRGVERGLLRRIEPFPTAQAVPYETGYLSGFLVEHYQLVLFEAFKQAREEMVTELRQLASRDVPGDTQRNLEIRPEFSGQTFKHLLVPVWLAGYRWRGRGYQLVLNGVSGQVAGRYPKSWIKILLALAGAAAIAALIALAALLTSRS